MKNDCSKLLNHLRSIVNEATQDVITLIGPYIFMLLSVHPSLNIPYKNTPKSTPYKNPYNRHSYISYQCYRQTPLEFLVWKFRYISVLFPFLYLQYIMIKKKALQTYTNIQIHSFIYTYIHTYILFYFILYIPGTYRQGWHLPP